MRILVIASQKGGVGKTTLAGHLAVRAEQVKEGPVALIDTDPQGSLADWWNERKAETPLFCKSDLNHLAATLAQLRDNGIKLVIIDTPPAVTDTISQVMAHADLILVPTRPSPHDLRAVGSTVTLAEKNGKKMIFVINGATPKAKLTGEAAIALSQHGTVASATIHHRVDFAASMIDGRSVQEIDAKSKSTAELAALWKYVSAHLSKS